MEGLYDFAAVAAAVVVSLGIALSLEWFALNTLMKLMPPRQAATAINQGTATVPASGPSLVTPASEFVARKRAA